jgi:hypothetical protein
MPTIKQTLIAIKALPGMTARYASEYKEFTVRMIGNNNADYFTDDATDALQTAKAMSFRYQADSGKIVIS